MAITKEKKIELIKSYVEDLKSSNNVVIVQQNAVPVNAANNLRKDMSGTDGKFSVIRKRLFLRAVKEAWLDEIDIKVLEGPIVALYAKGDEYAPLKVVNKYLKKFKYDDEWSSFSFLWGWFGKKRESAEYVDELANIPTKEELLSKLAYLFNYPLQSFAVVLNEIAKKLWGGEPVVEAVAETPVVEVVAEVAVVETPVPEVTAEVPAEEAKAE